MESGCGRSSSGHSTTSASRQTRSLWVVEGIARVYGDLLLYRAGLSTRDEFLGALSDKVDALQTTPGRAVQSVTSASFDAWIKLYRPDENSPNASISYYVKGAVVAFLLDLEIRRVSSNLRSLDDVMRVAYERFAGACGFTGEEFRALVGEVAGTSLAAFLSSALDGTGELDYTALEWLGLRFRTAESAAGKTPGRAALGVATRMDGNRLVVSQVRRGTVAHQAGINVDDEIIAIDDFRVRPDQLDARVGAVRRGRPRVAPGCTARSTAST